MAIKKRGFTIRKLFLGNITAKLMALAMAIALWLYAYNFSMMRDQTYEVPVTIVAPNGWAVAEVEPDSVKVTMDFPRRFEQDMEQARISRKIGVRLECRLRNEDAENDEITLSRVLNSALHLKTPAYAIRNAQFNPPSLSIRLVQEDIVELPVLLQYNAPPDGYEVVEAPTITPAKVKVTGRKDVLAKAKDIGIETEEVDISKAPVSFAGWAFDGPVTLKQTVTVDGQVSRVRPALDKVQYRIELAQKGKTKPFGKMNINISTPFDYPYLVEFAGKQRAEASVEVTGPETIVNKLDKANIVLYVRPSVSHKPAEVPHSLPIHVDFVNTPRESALNVTIDPPSVDVHIRERVLETRN